MVTQDGRLAGSEAATDPVLRRAQKEFTCAVYPLQEERALSLQDRRFAFIAGAQWEDQWLDAFENSIRVEINKVAAGLQKIIDDYRDNRVTVNFRAADNRASSDTADMLDGLFRADAYRSKAQQAFDNAFEEGVAGGYGAWRLVNEMEDELDPENDRQRIAIRAIPDADQSVFWDPNAKLYDKSDAMYCFVITAMDRDAFIEEWGADRCVEWPSRLYKPHYDWYTPRVVRVAEYYRVEIVKEKLWIFRNPLTDEEQRFWTSELDESLQEELRLTGWRLDRTRMGKRRRVHKWILSGAEILRDEGYIAGDQIPIVPFYGQRRFIDNMERVKGHVRDAKDPQRTYNAQISKLVETSALSPIERPVFDPEQMPPHLADQWARAHLDRAPYGLAKALRDTDGNIVHLGPIAKVEAPQIPPAVAGLIQIAATDIKELTNADDGADEVKANVSAEAMDIAATRTDAKSAIYMDNFRQSMQRCGEIYLSMARDVYVEEGREVETLGPNGEDGTSILHEAYTDEMGRYRVRNDLSRGKYKVISDVTEATATRRDKTVKTCFAGAQMIGQSDPELSQALAITAFLNMDGEGVDDLQKWLRRRALQIGLVQPTEEEAQQLAQAAQSQQPDPQAQALLAMAAKEAALAQKAEADTAKSRADTIKTLADAQKIRSETIKTDAEAMRVANEAALSSVASRSPIIQGVQDFASF